MSLGKMNENRYEENCLNVFKALQGWLCICIICIFSFAQQRKLFLLYLKVPVYFPLIAIAIMDAVSISLDHTIIILVFLKVYSCP